MNYFIYRYFDQEYERPDESAISLIVNEHGGVLFDYVTSSFLNGYINSVDIINAYGVNRYNPYEPINPDALKTFHPRLSDYRDDVMLLGRSKTRDKSYFIFHYSINGGTNDLIGNFITDDDESEIIANFIIYCNSVNEYRNEGIENTEFDIKDFPIVKLPKLSGWIKG